MSYTVNSLIGMDTKQQQVASRQQRLALLVEPYRETDPTVAVCLVENVDAMKVCALWPLTPKRWSPAKGGMPDDAAARLEWLWEGCVYDEVWLRETSLVEPDHRFVQVFNMLARARLILPDGSVTMAARALMQRRLARELSKGSARTRARTGRR